MSNNPSTFEYGVHGDLSGSGSGDFYLIALVPSNKIPPTFNVSISATNTGNASASPVDAGSFTSGALDGVLDNVTNGFSGLGNGHPLSSYLGATQLAGVDPTATGYEVFTYAFGDVSFPTLPVFTDSAVPVGTVFTAILTTDDTKDVILDSPNSEGLLVTTVGGHTSTPEPKYVGLLVMAMLSLFGVSYRRTRA